jgi:hydantoinase/carbamoylase family amidase
MRDDALVKTARFILAVDEEARRADDMVATMGRVSVYPDAANVIPGLVRMTLGMRSMKQERVDLALARLQEVARSLSAVDMETIISKLPVLMDESLVNEIEQACAGMGLRYKRMPSGAGHDAMCIARVAPVGMIFVPSRDGKSHVREEFTAWQYAVLGAQVLLNTIASLA